MTPQTQRTQLGTELGTQPGTHSRAERETQPTTKPKTQRTSRVRLALGALLVLTLASLGSYDALAQRARRPSGGSSSLSQLPVVRERLDNGLRVVMSPDRSIPTVAVAIYYDVGSRNEVRGRSGFAHLFEHMMFQGSANVRKGEHFTFIDSRGGDMNGTTSSDRTNYYETLPSNDLALGLWLEADRMRSLAITEENFENQRQTVKEERRQSYDNRPYMNSILRINELAYGSYWPYAHSTIGDMADLDAATLPDVQAFFDAYYPPNNAVLSISGDFDPAEAMVLVRQYFGDIPSRPVPAYEPGPIAPQTGEIVESMTDPLAPFPAFHVDYRIPPSREADHYALEMLGLILGDGESSRLYRILVKEREICQQLHVGTDDQRGPDLFSVFGIMAGTHQPAEARQVVYEQLESIAQTGVTNRELQKARNRVASYFVFGIQSSLDRAQRLAEFEMYYGNAELLRTEIDHYNAVTLADIQRVAQQYFGPTQRTVLDVLPPAAAAGAAQNGANP
ncbi:MAG: insulinase family protein [Sandaracinaceae bacterium]|nr:insulinase family protein [Myxococcales bacterium]MCB9659402.1 insulinase family protein [Sandaracinaceae bacterium]